MAQQNSAHFKVYLTILYMYAKILCIDLQGKRSGKIWSLMLLFEDMQKVRHCCKLISCN